MSPLILSIGFSVFGFGPWFGIWWWEPQCSNWFLSFGLRGIEIELGRLELNLNWF